MTLISIIYVLCVKAILYAPKSVAFTYNHLIPKIDFHSPDEGCTRITTSCCISMSFSEI